jgi:beta-glucanase (GH16 family)
MDLIKVKNKVSTLAVVMLMTIRMIMAQSGYDHLVWSDEFDESGSPDPTLWTFDIGGDGWGNNELQYYTSRSDNVFVENGKLIITARKENYGGNAYTSARITSRNRGDWKYCRVEVRAKLPEGRGTWPAIWMLPTDWEYGGWPASGEIDIMEHVGYDMGTVHGTVHTEAYNGADGTQRGGDIYLDDAHTAFHVYAIEWDADSIHFIVDSENYFTFPNYGTGYERWPFDKRFHLLMNIAIGGNWGGIEGVDDSIFPQTLEIDYVRVYQKFQQHDILGPDQVDTRQEDLVYRIPDFPGATYSWTFPDGVTIDNGQGTSEVSVTWGDTGGTITLEQAYEEEVFTSTLDVSIVQVPEGDTLIIKGDEIQLGSWESHPGEGNTLQIFYED